MNIQQQGAPEPGNGVHARGRKQTLGVGFPCSMFSAKDQCVLCTNTYVNHQVQAQSFAQLLFVCWGEGNSTEFYLRFVSCLLKLVNIGEQLIFLLAPSLMVDSGVSLIDGLESGMDGGWKIHQCMQLQLTHVTGTDQSSLSYLCVSRALISPQRLYKQVQFCRHTSLSGDVTVRKLGFLRVSGFIFYYQAAHDQAAHDQLQ